MQGGGVIVGADEEDAEDVVIVWKVSVEDTEFWPVVYAELVVLSVPVVESKLVVPLDSPELELGSELEETEHESPSSLFIPAGGAGSSAVGTF